MLVVIYPVEFNYLFMFVRYLVLPKYKGKGMYKNRLTTIWTNKVDTIEDPQNNHTIGDQCHSWDFHVGCCSSL